MNVIRIEFDCAEDRHEFIKEIDKAIDTLEYEYSQKWTRQEFIKKAVWNMTIEIKKKQGIYIK